MLLKNPKFQQEYREFSEKINSLSNEKAKTEAQRLLKELVTEVRRLDHNHQELMFQRQLPDDIGQSRNKLTEIRKKIVKILDN